MKGDPAKIGATLDTLPPDIRLYLFYGPDEAGAAALAARAAHALGPDGERIDLDGATLRGDPARLADEAASLSLFGGARLVRVTGMGEESLDAVAALLDAPRAGNPVVALAPALKATAKVVKLALDSRAAFAVACEPPRGAGALHMVAQIGREHGLRIAEPVARRLLRASAADRAVLTQEIAKYALYLDAAPDRPATLEDDTIDAVGADLSEAGMFAVVDAVLAGRGAALADTLRLYKQDNGVAVPWLRQLGKRLATIAEVKADARGGDINGALQRHRIFGRDEAATRAALARFTPAQIAAAQRAVREAERAVMASGTAGDVLADHTALRLTREGK